MLPSLRSGEGPGVGLKTCSPLAPCGRGAGGEGFNILKFIAQQPDDRIKVFVAAPAEIDENH